MDDFAYLSLTSNDFTFFVSPTYPATWALITQWPAWPIVCLYFVCLQRIFIIFVFIGFLTAMFIILPQHTPVHSSTSATGQVQYIFNHSNEGASL